MSYLGKFEKQDIVYDIFKIYPISLMLSLHSEDILNVGTTLIALYYVSISILFKLCVDKCDIKLI